MQHLACIMDGNRRWARQRNLPSNLGHRQGVESIRTVTSFCLKQQIKYLSLYTFSLENFKRSLDERSYLFDLICYYAEQYITDFCKEGIRVQFIGDQNLFPEQVRPTIERVQERTKDGKQLHINFLFCYGARQEIVDGIKRLIKKVKEGTITEQSIDEHTFANYLWTANIPAPDLILRTGGANRLSNFLLYQAAYSELYFLDCLWPDIAEDHLQKAWNYFVDCKRNFGS